MINIKMIKRSRENSVLRYGLHFYDFFHEHGICSFSSCRIEPDGNTGRKAAKQQGQGTSPVLSIYQRDHFLSYICQERDLSPVQYLTT